jgi:8-oxo-dGTP pyrophosphatase MutT (NUDIX family)
MADLVLENWKKYLKETKKPPESNSAAGFLLLNPSNNSVLLMRRAAGGNVGELAGPGGMMEEGEKAIDTAVREAREEIGKDFSGKDFNEEIESVNSDGLTFTTFVWAGLDEDPCNLNDEHDAWGWAGIDDVLYAIDNMDGHLISRDFYDREGNEIEVEAKILDNVINVLRQLNFK